MHGEDDRVFREKDYKMRRNVLETELGQKVFNQSKRLEKMLHNKHYP